MTNISRAGSRAKAPKFRHGLGWVVGAAAVTLSLVGTGLAATNRADDVTDAITVHPQEFVIARLSAPAQDGDRTISVEDAALLDPRALMLLKTVDGRIQETNCIKSIQGDRVKLTQKLSHDFPTGTYVIQTSLARSRGPVGSLLDKGDDGSSHILLRDAANVDALQRVVVQSPDRKIREAHCVRWVDGNRVRLADDLRNDFPPNSSVVQGDLVGGELALDQPCCCDGKGKCCTDRLIGTLEPPPPVIPPLPPLGVTCRASSPTIVQGGTATIDAVVTGAEGGDVAYTWTVDGSPVSYAGGTLRLEPVDLEPGSHVVRAVVTSTDSRTANCEYAFTVDPRPNRDPICRVVISPQSVVAGERVQIRSEASDPDGDPLSYSWTLDEQPYPDTTASWVLDSSPLSGGNHLARVAVRDGRGGLCSSVATLGVREKIVVQIDNRADNVAKAQLDEIALKLQSNQQLTASITGHADATGAAGANQRLGLRRAGLLRDYLVSQHQINPNRIEVQSVGSSEPIASNLTTEGRRRNRRAEVELYVPGS